MTQNEVCECGHHRTDHIYEEAACRPGYRCEDDCGAFKPATSGEDDLLADLRAAEVANGTIDHCDACEAIDGASEDLRPALSNALAGTIGENKLSAILTRRGYSVGRRAIARHRREAHTP